MTLQVIGAALPRTGTLSLKFALEKLGFGPCYHMSELILHPEHRWRWTFARLRPALLDPLWTRYSAALDAPACMMWQPLAERFPQAKVILNRRDPDKWYESVMATVARPEQTRMMLRSPLAPALLMDPPFGWRLNRYAMTKHFVAYGDKVRSAITPERLLEFEAKDGWEPLCKFLGVPVRDVPFPRVNDREAMQTATEERMTFPEMQAKVREVMAEADQSLWAR